MIIIKNWSTKNKYAQDSVVVHGISWYGTHLVKYLYWNTHKSTEDNLPGRIGCQLHEK